LLADKYYEARHGSTDSELFFLLMLTNGLEQDARYAVEYSIEQVTKLAIANNALGSPIRITCVFSDGEKVFGFRHASDNKSPTLYLSDCLDHGGRAVASEPLHGTGEKWQTINVNRLVEVSRQTVQQYCLRVTRANPA
jgi:predicted glutamine amidotransferase